MKCPTCGKAELESKSGDVIFRKRALHTTWRECPKCEEKLWDAAEVKRLEALSKDK